MAISKNQESKNPNDNESESLKLEVASFASSIGLSSSLPNSGFNDSDFRKTGTFLKPSKPFIINKTTTTTPKSLKPLNEVQVKKKFQKNLKLERKNNDSNELKVFNRYNDLPKLPLIKADRLEDVWYVEAQKLEEKVIIGKDGKKKIEPMDQVERKRLVEENKQLGERLLVQYAQDFDNSRRNSGGMKLHRAMQRSGTAIDKVLAYMDIVVQNPIANIKSLDALLAMVTSKVGKRHALTVFEPLKELFLDRLLPKDRKLKILIQQPVNHLPKSRDGYSLLLFWYWEECLKQKYERFIFALEEASRDILPILKDKAIKTMCALFEGNQAQERRLLSALVNKLGDPENKCAANASYNLLKNFKVHPYMKAVVIDEVDHFLFRPHLGLRAKYHAVNFLSNIKLSSVGDGPMVAMQLMKVYFALFKVLTEAEESKTLENNKEDRNVKRSLENSKEEGPVESNVETDSRILSTLLTGVNRAFNFVASDKVDDFVEVQTPILFKLVHSKNINVGLGALLFLEKVSSRNQVVSDRFYRALYSKFLLPAAMNSSKVGMFLDLLLRAMTSDVNLKRVSAFLKRLMQVALQQPPRFACASLFLLSEVLKARPPLWNMMLQNESSDEELEHFKDIIEGPLAELEAEPAKLSKNTDRNACNSNNVAKADSDSSDLEIQDDTRASDSDDFDGADDFLTGDCVDDVEKFKTTSTSGKEQPRSYHVWSSLPGGYDPRHREPSYCHAERASWWELMVLASHVHPSVSTMARTLLAGANVVYNGDPLKDFSLIAFLDKLIEKKPKQTTWHGGSEIEPSKKLDTSNHLIGPEILSLAEVDVPPEDLVFHKFYMNKMNSSKKPKKKKKKTKMQDEAAEEIFGVDANNESDEEIGGDESDNEEIDDIIDSGDIPEEADGNYDYDDYDQVADEGDEDLIGSDSDAETDAPSDMEEGEDDGFDLINTGEADGNFGLSSERQGKQKSRAKTGVSPFAPLEEYDHLLKNDGDEGGSTRKKSKSRKKRRMSE